jgi:acylglycerol lipase
MTRLLPLLLLAFALAACAGEGTGHPSALGAIGNAAPSGPAVQPLLADKAFIADDGVSLPLRVWLPEGEPKAVILALHGFNDYSNAFVAPAAEWAKHGIATYAYDQRGFGEAPLHGRWAGVAQLARDVTAASRLLRARYGATPIYLLGESMGGAVVIVAVSGAAGTPPPDVDGVILSAPAVWGRDMMTVLERVALWTGDAFFPDMTFTGRGLRIMPSDNILVDLRDMALYAAPRVTMPMLMLYGERDEVVPNAATLRWIETLPYGQRMTRRIALYTAGYHMLLRDLEGPVVMHDVESWVADHQAPLPSGADRNASAMLYARR